MCWAATAGTCSAARWTQRGRYLRALAPDASRASTIAPMSARACRRGGRRADVGGAGAYGGAGQTLACLDSVLAALPRAEPG